MKTFRELKKETVKRCKAKSACEPEFKKLVASEDLQSFLEVICNNIYWCKENIFDDEFLKEYDQLLNNGKENSGVGNSGDLNSGDLNSGNLNSGDLNSGDLNSGDLNSGYRNSGDLNSGDLNSGYRNSGNLNSGDLNSGDLNSGYRNSGVFCNRKKEDAVYFFNEESKMTWNQWYEHPVYNLCSKLIIVEWIDWDNMTEKEKAKNKSAYICGGYNKVYGYKEAWKNLWKLLKTPEKEEFKKLPNFNAEIFEDITGIKI